ncbi:MAG: DinB family protein [Acidobacteriota bacterium]|nr:DinB family protein [Acidobacteriota bacterium]
MTNDLAVLITEIDANLSHAESLAAGLSHSQFNWRPGAASWSIGQCVSHLNLVNGQDLAPLRAAIERGKSRQLLGDGPFTYGFLSRKFVAGMEPPVKRKFKAPRTYLPPQDCDPQTTLAEFRRLSKELRTLAQSASGLHLARVKTALPALPPLLRTFVKMPLGARLEAITAHDRRHLWQAEAVRNHSEFQL